MASSAESQGQALIARSKTLVNNDLKRICKEEGMTVSGNKAQLQSRVINRIEAIISGGDAEALNRLRYRLNNHGASPPSSASPAYSSPVQHSMPVIGNGYGGGQRYAPYQPPPTIGGSRIFKDSPFYQIEELLLSDIKLEASPSHRQTTTRSLTLSADQALRMRGDSELKLLLFSAMDNPLISYGQQDVAFPSQIEVKINGDEVKANFKGLKNKPGSTRPADITDYVRKSPANYRNSIQVTYALTQKVSSIHKYNIYVYLVKKHSIASLAKHIKERQVITKHNVLRESEEKANDADIEVGSVNLSLKDPISTLRITIPCRSMICSHNQCFDAESFLQLQEQAPTWNCPICNKTVSYQGLAVDQYVQEILQSVSKSTDQVTIEPNGEWHHTQPGNDQTPRTNGYGNGYADSYDEDSEEDLVDITDSRSRVSAIKSEAVPTPQSLARTPPLSSREASSAPRTGSKRTSEVIDLTLSDEDEPSRPAKKVAYSTPSSLSDPLHRYQQPPPTFGPSSVPMRPQAQTYNSMPSAMRLDPPRNHPDAPPSYRPPPPRNSFPGYGTSTHPTYLGSSP
ncbi:hypothetical protein K491DRAFT_741916 [Lophiostoma macrostomum CBS 122681]|uniref:E3 SUMO-protein ligase PIAS1 n=1 Tax=Lophiostoma macrostomum CBS 122681 TaxID=1314788 RepID=A0A6A6TBP1_9PLEO|nr:hypothetical protein K491DRAFT_741916 [Lophiostoma macrostomum CBS 122681]